MRGIGNQVRREERMDAVKEITAPSPMQFLYTKVAGAAIRGHTTTTKMVVH
jgi:hypothetical protein